MTEKPTGTSAGADGSGAGGLLVYLLFGAGFGAILIKSGAASWFLIQEMLRFQGFTLFGVLGSAAVVAGVALVLIRARVPRALDGTAITIPAKAWGSGTRYWVGGTIFGLGWALAGVCPGTIFALLGAGVGPAVLPLLAAFAGMWTYGWLRPRLPH